MTEVKDGGANDCFINRAKHFNGHTGALHIQLVT